ncbi:Bor family protein [Sulfobacillus acidophilus]|uniref:Bor family protein n=1 Tax=Sulfobacillus acidophilus TaxID=53633 RepID=A0ABS3AWM5_9FIRM|nr:Bor family protein [Sulfobacillus acidophilus]
MIKEIRVKKLKLLVPILGILFLSGCYNHTIRYGRGGTIKKYDKNMNFFVFGLAGQPTIKLNRICKDPTNSTVKTQQTFLNSLLSGLTLGIYTPRTAKVYCRK